MKNFYKIRVSFALSASLLSFGCENSSADWAEVSRGGFVNSCIEGAQTNPALTHESSIHYCECIQQQIEERYSYAEYELNEAKIVLDLAQDKTILDCQVVAYSKTNESQEPEPIDLNPSNPSLDKTTSQQFVSKRYAFQIRRPEEWDNVLMDGQIQWHVASNHGIGPENCFVKVSEDYSFGIIGNAGWTESAVKQRQQLLDMLKVRYNVPTINLFDVHEFGGQDAVRTIYTGEIDERRETGFTLQSVRGAKLYTFGCLALSDDFPNRYLLFQRIADTFKFIN